MSNTITITLGGTLIAAVMFGSPAVAGDAKAIPIDFGNAAFAPATGPTSIPVGAADFCKRDPSDCLPVGKVAQAQMLTKASWAELVAVNDDVNSRIIPQTDQDNYHVAEYWTYPTDGRGDCEDIALEKRRELIALGWDASTLLMTVVREPNGDGHAVLMARTDRGDLILDNQDNRVLVWNKTPYEFVKRQSQDSMSNWVALNDNRSIVVATANN